MWITGSGDLSLSLTMSISSFHAVLCVLPLHQPQRNQRLPDDGADGLSRIQAGIGILEDHLHHFCGTDASACRSVC